ncbi:MAG: hypothetical protein PWP65_2038 [Clostridia bacterium]|nr:hypothetical protein [Clostridia bacterium]
MPELPHTELRIVPRDFQPQTEVLKEGNIFLVSLPNGEISSGNMGGLGLYMSDTRYLSSLELTLWGHRPVFLSTGTRDSHFAQIELTNPEITLPEGVTVPLQTVHLRLLRVIQDAFYQRFRIINFNPFPLTLPLEISLSADFRDIFEIRGTLRERRGELLNPTVEKNGLIFAYRGLDNRLRSTSVVLDPPPDSIVAEPGRALIRYQLELQPQQKVYLYLQVRPEPDNFPKDKAMLEVSFCSASITQAERYQEYREANTKIITDNAILNGMFQQAATDLRALQTTYDDGGMILDAGIPWYAAPFGRDSLITSWQTLIFDPNIARNTLRFLARYQGQKVDRWREERPGKILHELRFGEMARCNEVPHTPYYGSVDSTLWFIIMLAETYRWTQDDNFLQEMAEALKGCLHWCRWYGDLDGDGYIEYLSESSVGLTNQGWKDSWDGVVDADGRIPPGPIALVEVQAYYYLALNDAAFLLTKLGEINTARRLSKRAAALQENFLRDFWNQGNDYPIFALDGQKKAVTTLVSNGGHCLFTGILPPEKAIRVAKRLMAPDFFSGWGIRTMSKDEKAYNPMSYHNGSVWPHDNAIIAAGFRRYNYLEELTRLAEALFAASLFFPYNRWPELFCGFTRRGLAGPVRYPIACDPQAWAVGSLYSLTRSLLGLNCEGGTLYINQPLLLPGTNEIEVRDLRVGNGKVDLAFGRDQGGTFCRVLKKEGGVRVVIEV